jgi:hypothetical protein
MQLGQRVIYGYKPKTIDETMKREHKSTNNDL